jgi:hypothetical protein
MRFNADCSVHVDCNLKHCPKCQCVAVVPATAAEKKHFRFPSKSPTKQCQCARPFWGKHCQHQGVRAILTTTGQHPPDQTLPPPSQRIADAAVKWAGTGRSWAPTPFTEKTRFALLARNQKRTMQKRLFMTVCRTDAECNSQEGSGNSCTFPKAGAHKNWGTCSCGAGGFPRPARAHPPTHTHPRRHRHHHTATPPPQPRPTSLTPPCPSPPLPTSPNCLSGFPRAGWVGKFCDTRPLSNSAMRSLNYTRCAVRTASARSLAARKPGNQLHHALFPNSPNADTSVPTTPTAPRPPPPPRRRIAPRPFGHFVFRSKTAGGRTSTRRGHRRRSSTTTSRRRTNRRRSRRRRARSLSTLTSVRTRLAGRR